MSHIVASPADDSTQPRRSPHDRVMLALSLLQHRRHDDRTVELAVMALRGADIDALLAAERQMGGD